MIEELPLHTARVYFHVGSDHRSIAVLAATPNGLIPMWEGTFDRCVVLARGGET